MHYKVVAPPSEGNELNLCLLSSARVQLRILVVRWRIFPQFSVFGRQWQIIRPRSDSLFFDK